MFKRTNVRINLTTHFFVFHTNEPFELDSTRPPVQIRAMPARFRGHENMITVTFKDNMQGS